MHTLRLPLTTPLLGARAAHALHVLGRRRTRRWIVGGGVGLATLVSGCLMLGAALARSAPSWWRNIPREDPSMMSLARRVEGTVQSEVFQNRPARRDGALWRSEPWSIRLSAEEASAWLSIRMPMWLANSEDHFRWPREVEEVQVLFGEGSVTVGARVRSRPAAPQARVLTATLAPHLDDDGRLFIPAGRVNLGRVAMPAAWVLDHIRGAADRYFPPDVRALPETETMLRAFEGESALVERAVFKLGDGRRVRLLGFSVEDGILEVRCQTERPG